MPLFDDNDTAGGGTSLEQHNVGHFGFTATNLDDLGAAGYTLATLVLDRSGSTEGFQKEMEQAVKACVEALKGSKTIDPETIMLRVLTVDSQCEELHGFIPLADIDPARYDGTLKARGMTAMYDGLVNASEAAAAYGEQLTKDHFTANAITIGITDGLNNAGRFSRQSDVVAVKAAFEAAKKRECLESHTTILIGVNASGTFDGVRVGDALKQFHSEAGFTVPMIDLKDASPQTIAKIGRFITDSVSSTSKSLGTGAASQKITF